MYITGNPDGWHGSLDNVLECDECFIRVPSPENEVGHKSMEVKQKNVEELGFCSQTLAQVFVLSFQQKQRHPTLTISLFPAYQQLKMKSKFIFMTVYCWKEEE